MSFERGFRGYATGVLGALTLLLMASSPSHASTAVSACGTLSMPGNYFLTKNLTATGTCITVASEGVSLDMKGHTITGNGTGDGVSDGNVLFESMAIANGKIRNFSDGIGLHKSCCVVIRNVDSSNNTGIGVLVGGCCSTLDSVTTNGNSGDGIDALECCYTLNNIQSKNNHGGGVISKTNACCTTLSNSTVSGNGGVGVDMEDCCNFLVSSTVQRNKADGVDMDGGGRSTANNFVVNSTVALNIGTGVHLIGNDNLVTNSVASGNGSDGIFLSTTGSQIASSQSNGNQGVGANVGCPGAITGLSTKNNNGGPLTTTGGTCTQLNNKLN